MKHTHLMIAGLVVAGVCVGRLSAQGTDNFSVPLQSNLATGGAKEIGEASLAIRSAAGDAAKTQAVARMLLDWDSRARPKETLATALVISQNQKLLEQNNEIIALLKQIRDKKN